MTAFNQPLFLSQLPDSLFFLLNSHHFAFHFYSFVFFLPNGNIVVFDGVEIWIKVIDRSQLILYLQRCLVSGSLVSVFLILFIFVARLNLRQDLIGLTFEGLHGGIYWEKRFVAHNLIFIFLTEKVILILNWVVLDGVKGSQFHYFLTFLCIVFKLSSAPATVIVIWHNFKVFEAGHFSQKVWINSHLMGKPIKLCLCHFLSFLFLVLANVSAIRDLRVIDGNGT